MSSGVFISSNIRSLDKRYNKEMIYKQLNNDVRIFQNQCKEIKSLDKKIEKIMNSTKEITELHYFAHFRGLPEDLSCYL